MPRPNTVDDFYDRLVKRDDGCWEWKGHREDRYGRFSYEGEKWAHRSSYLIHHGLIPDGLEIDHLCRFTFCVNPDHLEAVTHEENVRRATAARTPAAHGTTARAWSGCNCGPCRSALSKRNKELRAEKQRRFRAGEIEIRHGRTGYASYGCRCDTCKSAYLPTVRAYRRKKGVKPFKPAEHGTISMYSGKGCRCRKCRDAWAAYWREHRAKKKEAA